MIETEALKKYIDELRPRNTAVSDDTFDYFSGVITIQL